MRDLVGDINRALRARGWSARRASMEAVGAPELVRNIRRGQLPSVKRLLALCDVLDLEFYIGARRPAGAVDEGRLQDAVESMERALESHDLRLAPKARARVATALYELLDPERDPTTAHQVKRLIEGLTTEDDPATDV